MSKKEKADEVYNQYKDIYKKGVKIKDSHNDIFEVRNLKVIKLGNSDDDWTVYCDYNKISNPDDNDMTLSDSIFHIIKNFEIVQ